MTDGAAIYFSGAGEAVVATALSPTSDTWTSLWQSDAGFFGPVALADGYVLAGGISNNAVSALTPDSGQIVWGIGNGTTQVTGFEAVVGSSGLTIWDGNGLTAAPLLGSSFTSAAYGGPSSALALGQGGLIYVADGVGELLVTDTSLTVNWSAPIISGFLTLDCSRDSAGVPRPGRPGVLYAESATSLLAVVVDSRGLDTGAAWPMAQHDPRNTANSSTSLAQFACP
jgi:hypothetical protein